MLALTEVVCMVELTKRQGSVAAWGGREACAAHADAIHALHEAHRRQLNEHAPVLASTVFCQAWGVRSSLALRLSI